MGDTVVLVPYDDGVAALAAVPGVQAVRYDPDGRLPPEAATAQVFVPPFLASTRVVDLVEQLPELRLVQLLTAGAEIWVGRLPAQVALSDCRGAHGGATAEWIVAVLLAVYRELPGFVRSQDARRWDQHFTDELAGKRVLLVGAGDLADNDRGAGWRRSRSPSRWSVAGPAMASTASPTCTLSCRTTTSPYSWSR